MAAQAITQLGGAIERGVEVRSPAAYYWRAALNLIVDEVRRREREQPFDPVLGLSEDEMERGNLYPSRPLSLELADFPPEFDRAIRELPEDERDAFILTELRGLTTRESAPVIGVSHMTVSRRANAAREHVRQEIR